MLATIASLSDAGLRDRASIARRCWRRLVIVAELLGHARLETTRAYSRPTQQDAIDALELLDVDR
jgi:hypothetical protein